MVQTCCASLELRSARLLTWLGMAGRTSSRGAKVIGASFASAVLLWMCQPLPQLLLLQPLPVRDPSYSPRWDSLTWVLGCVCYGVAVGFAIELGLRRPTLRWACAGGTLAPYWVTVVLVSAATGVPLADVPIFGLIVFMYMTVGQGWLAFLIALAAIHLSGHCRRSTRPRSALTATPAEE